MNARWRRPRSGPLRSPTGERIIRNRPDRLRPPCPATRNPPRCRIGAKADRAIGNAGAIEFMREIGLIRNAKWPERSRSSRIAPDGKPTPDPSRRRGAALRAGIARRILLSGLHSVPAPRFVRRPRIASRRGICLSAGLRARPSRSRSAAKSEDGAVGTLGSTRTAACGDARLENAPLFYLRSPGPPAKPDVRLDRRQKRNRPPCSPRNRRIPVRIGLRAQAGAHGQDSPRRVSGRRGNSRTFSDMIGPETVPSGHWIATAASSPDRLPKSGVSDTNPRIECS